MPFTPFHFGPGLLFKAAAGARFSFVAFLVSQVFIDLEPLIRILRGDSVLHGWTHTLLGAAVLGLLAGGVAYVASDARFTFLKVRLPLSVNLTGALVGTFSHLLLDGFMHHDMSPFSPITMANPLLGLVTLRLLHLGCVAAGVIGLVGVVIRNRTKSETP